MHPVKYGSHHHHHHHLQQQQQQRFMADENDSSSASVFFISNPQQHQPVFLHPLHSQQHSSPVTQQLFQHHQAQFQPFQHPESVHHRQQPFSAVDFKLGLNENSGKKEVALPLNHHHTEPTFFHANQQQQHSLLVPHCLHPQEDSPIKEPFWKPLNRCENVGREIEGSKCNKVSQPTSERNKNLDNKYRFFGELEAIYGLEAGSGSALTEFQGHNAGANGGVGNGSETTSIGKQASFMKKIQKKKRKMRMKEDLSSIVVFFGSLVKQVSDHQECLHKRFLEVVERMDKERCLKEESWRQQEVERRNREAIARAHEQALASSREALIVSYLEKITGESINLPQRSTPLLVQPESVIVKADNSGRWPIAEVEALIQVRCSLESKFREPGLKGSLWEEVSCLMSSFGYQRSAKRCKEKWENINKYFRKSKENGKKRSQHSKTCSYFDQLDQLYSRIPLINSDVEMQKQGDSDFLEPYIPQRDHVTHQVNVNGNLKVSEMNSPKLDFDGTAGDNVKDSESHGNYLENDSDGGE
ncbi:hypothetical protein HRI_003166000 [Hibiscus trionum]|uniref:Myb-like domain-containing protein n=1 Tax=Hibiscus trionum TaxID=183268 RepID=A0A9W7M962_HIBTR|nr:hypothetical protein HRI_003166000 [Hibiscus trionum]